MLFTRRKFKKKKKEIRSVEDKIYESIRRTRPGMVFFADDFIKFGNQKACNKALEVLTKQDKMMRLARGIYSLPKTGKNFSSPPSKEEIIQAIIKRDKVRIIPTGLTAMYLLGLLPEEPRDTFYLTNGSLRRLRIGSSIIVFKRTAPRYLAIKGKISSLAIQALKMIGKDKVSEQDENKIVEMLKTENTDLLIRDIEIAPVWMQDIMSKALTEEDILNHLEKRIEKRWKELEAAGKC